MSNDAHKTLPQAIATMEGYYNTQPPSRARRNNNPGNIEWGAFARSQGASHCEPDGMAYKGRFAVFNSAADGFAALRMLLLGTSYRDLTIAQAIHRYAPPKENDTTNYVAQVCRWVGCTTTQTVAQVMTEQPAPAGKIA